MDAAQPLLLAGLLANYNKFETYNPYHARFADFVNHETIVQICKSIETTCGFLRDQYVAIQDDVPEAWSIGGTLSYIGLGALAGAKPAVPAPTEGEMKAKFAEQWVHLHLARMLLTYADRNRKQEHCSQYTILSAPTRHSVQTLSEPTAMKSHKAHPLLNIFLSVLTYINTPIAHKGRHSMLILPCSRYRTWSRIWMW